MEQIESSYYSYIKHLPRLSNATVEKLYYQDGYKKENINDLINQTRKELYRNIELRNLHAMYGNYDASKDANNDEELRRKIESLERRKSALFAKGKGFDIRFYPSKELINKITTAHLYLAVYYATVFFKKGACEDGRFSFDDLYQIGAEALILAAKYYTPDGTAKFTTYASRCIANKLNKEVYASKKKEVVNKDFFFLEFEKMKLARRILARYYYDYSPREYRYCVTYYNRAMSKCFEKTIPGFRNGGTMEEYLKLYSSLIKNSHINELVDSNDEEFIYASLLNRKYNAGRRAMLVAMLRIDLYLWKLAAIKELIKFEKQYKKQNNGNPPSKEEEYKFLEHRILELERAKDRQKEKVSSAYDEMNRLCVRDIRLTNFTNVYQKEYGIYLLGEDDENRRHEKELLTQEFDEIVCDVEYLREIEPELVEYFYPDFIKKYYNGEDYNREAYIKDVIAERTKKVSAIVKKANASEIAENKRTIEEQDIIYSFASRISKGDFESIYKARITFYSLDEMSEEQGDKIKSKLPTPEENAIDEDIMEACDDVLNTLPELDREVFKLWLSRDGYSKYSLTEIAKLLGITPKRAFYAKERALKKLRKDKKLLSYLELSGSQ